ncbi:MAG TPA: mechanosensitive ion channel family protein, partial [Gammaproteobacteria bacterium]|nr:mechanosensitive ion channel family protein [Gammaproteobacteria bacterium]
QCLNQFIQESPLWDQKVCKLAITNFKENTVELRILVSSTNPGNLFDLQCFLREKLLHFICENYPQSLPKVRSNQFETVNS